MNLIPYLLFDGTCAEAVQFYTEVFGATVSSFQRWSEMPPNPDFPIPEEHKNRVMHARLDAKTFSLMASDGRPGTPQKGGNISLSLNLDDVAAGEQLFEALSSEGAVETPLTEMFWGAKFGQCTDKFGIDWMFNITLTPAQAIN
ncbi:MAG: VOC family protein [Candidatus Velthaea sp.]|jgi:PhnB protein